MLFAARRVMATKGAHTLLEAIGRLAAPPTVVVLGELDHLPAYTRRLRALARGCDVHFLGYVADKPLLLGLVAAAELFVFPSETEGMSIMLLEVARVGTPIVASSISENRAVFDDAEVLYFPAGDAPALAARIAEARRNPEAMRARAARARARILEQYAGERVAERYADLYERVLAEGASRGAAGRPAAARRRRLRASRHEQIGRLPGTVGRTEGRVRPGGPVGLPVEVPGRKQQVSAPVARLRRHRRVAARARALGCHRRGQERAERLLEASAARRLPAEEVLAGGVAQHDRRRA